MTCALPLIVRNSTGQLFVLDISDKTHSAAGTYKKVDNTTNSRQAAIDVAKARQATADRITIEAQQALDAALALPDWGDGDYTPGTVLTFEVYFKNYLTRKYTYTVLLAENGEWFTSAYAGSNRLSWNELTHFWDTHGVTEVWRVSEYERLLP